MLRLMTVLTVLLMTPLMGSAQSIQGAWRMVEREFQGGPNAGIQSGSQIQPSFLIYTEGYYSVTFVGGVEPRTTVFSEEPTDAELVAVWQPFSSQAGTYELNGTTLTYTIHAAKNPPQMLPENDRYGYSRNWALDQIAVLYGGRIAEEIVFNEITTGAGNDFDKASDLAHKMAKIIDETVVIIDD